MSLYHHYSQVVLVNICIHDTESKRPAITDHCKCTTPATLFIAQLVKYIIVSNMEVKNFPDPLRLSLHM